MYLFLQAEQGRCPSQRVLRERHRSQEAQSAPAAAEAEAEGEGEPLPDIVFFCSTCWYSLIDYLLLNDGSSGRC